MLFRFMINLLLNRLNIQKSLGNLRPTMEATIGCGSFNIIYHLARHFFAKMRMARKSKSTSFWLSQDMEMFTACSLASFGLLLAPENDLRIFKVMIFSRAVSSIFK